jgi:hypothetical protein
MKGRTFALIQPTQNKRIRNAPFATYVNTGKVYVKRANGEYVATTGWFSKVSSLDVMPGDAIFIPEDLNKTTFTKELKDWTQIIYQLGLGAAAITVLKD